VHAFKALLLRQAGFTAIWHDLLFLTIFATVMISIATPLFKRTL
jgi:ABC-type multidrug transport system permease subunit